MPNKKSDDKSDIRNWWAKRPMTYGIVHGKTNYENPSPEQENPNLGTKEFFESADNRFYSWNTPLHGDKGKFSKIFPYEHYVNKPVLEIGCGMGCMAMNWAQHGANLTATDLNPTSIEQTKRRFELFGLKGQIQEMDAHHLTFPDNSFDYVYSWGVIHHSPQIQNAISEIFRVLKPGGRIGIMLYNRNSFLYDYTIKWVEGYMNMEKEFLNEVELASRYGDGGREEGNPHTWPVTKKEVKQTLFKDFSNVKVDILGTDVESSVDMAFPRLGSWIVPRFILNALGRRWGWSLWITGEKP